MLGYRRKKF